MKSIRKENSKQLPVVQIDKSLNKYTSVVLFPEKVEKAKKDLEKYGLPDSNRPAR
ncbi:MAG: hypothetical protein INR73_27900 [Williamsia sp.]|nr:hypothetical protein [Williamsia sp.]